MSLENEPSHYETLALPFEATSMEIKKAYRKMALLHHPDKLRDRSEASVKRAEQMFHAINKAYEVLSDVELKVKYDKDLAAVFAKAKARAKEDEGMKNMRKELEKREAAHMQTYRQHTTKAQVAEATRQTEEEIQRMIDAGLFAPTRRGPGVATTERSNQNVASSSGPSSSSASASSAPVVSVTSILIKWKSRSKNVVNEQLLRGIFSVYGDLERVKLLSNGKSGILTFHSEEAAVEAAMHESDLLSIRLATSRDLEADTAATTATTSGSSKKDGGQSGSTSTAASHSSLLGGSLKKSGARAQRESETALAELEEREKALFSSLLG